MAAISRLDQLQNDLYRLVLEKHHQTNMATRHIAIETWLETLGMQDYLPCFSSYTGVEDILHLTETEVRDLGLKNPAHRAKIVSSLRILKEKYERSVMGKKTPVHQSHLPRSQNVTAQLSWSPPSLMNSPDYQVVNVPQEKLQHDLIVELQGDPADLKSRAWYHGNISRQHAEQLVIKNGDFLVRDCISKPGDFVLSCCWKGGPLHFVINSSVTDQGPGRLPKVTYHFEDVHFNSVQSLIQFYMDECKQITEITGAVITTPIGRTMPLSYYDNKFGAQASQTGNQYATVQVRTPATVTQSTRPPIGGQNESPKSSPRPSPHGTPKGSPSGSPGSLRRGSGARVERAGSQPLLSLNDLPMQILDRSDSLPMMSGLLRQFTPTSDQVLPTGDTGIYKTVTPTTPPPFPVTATSSSASQQQPHHFFHQRSGSAPVLTPGVLVTQHFDYLAPPTQLGPASSEGDLHKAPPPKPSRIPSVKYKQKPQVVIRNKELYDDDDRDYSDYGQVKSDPSWLQNSANQKQDSGINNQSERDVNQNVPKLNDRVPDPRYAVLDGNVDTNVPSFPLELNIHNKQQNNAIQAPKIEFESSFNLLTFSSVLLPNENKLLEPSALLKCRQMLLNTKATELARYMTSVDLQLLKVVSEDDLGVCVTSGLELITLPQGRQLRQDVLDRIYCLKVFVMITILTCPKVNDRSAMLSQWIQVAMEIKSLGNLFGFETVMEGIISEQVTRLRDTWMVLRQNHTSSAFVYDTKLKTVARSLQDGSGSLPVQNVCIPSITPMIQLMERTTDDQIYFPWELADNINFGLDIMLVHLDMARVITAQCGVYRVTGETLLKDLQPDNEKTEMFQTEFQLRFLWGSKGAGVERKERQNKFNMLLSAYSEKVEPEGDDGTAL